MAVGLVNKPVKRCPVRVVALFAKARSTLIFVEGRFELDLSRNIGVLAGEMSPKEAASIRDEA